MDGPDATARAMTHVADDPSSTLTPADATRLREIAGRVRTPSTEHPLTYGDLNEAQALMYRAGNTRELVAGADCAEVASTLRGIQSSRELTADMRSHVAGYARRLEGTPPSSSFTTAETNEMNDAMRLAGRPDRFASDDGILARRHTRSDSTDASALSDAELTGLARRTGFPTDTRRMTESESLADLTTRGALDPGESATVRVHGAGSVMDGATADSFADHFITVGRDSQGRMYIYNPDPGEGDHTMVTGDADVRRALRGYDDRIVRSGAGLMPTMTVMRSE